MKLYDNYNQNKFKYKIVRWRTVADKNKIFRYVYILKKKLLLIFYSLLYPPLLPYPSFLCIIITLYCENYVPIFIAAITHMTFQIITHWIYSRRTIIFKIFIRKWCIFFLGFNVNGWYISWWWCLDVWFSNHHAPELVWNSVLKIVINVYFSQLWFERSKWWYISHGSWILLWKLLRLFTMWRCVDIIIRPGTISR